MCELIFSNLNNQVLNRTYLYLQMLTDAETNKRDGFGIYTKETGIYKSGLDFTTVVNVKDFLIKQIQSNDPVMGHVRYATSLPGKTRIISTDNSHPFETDKLVLMHNGVVEFKDKKDYDNYSGITVDSVLFMQELDKHYDGTNFVAAFKATNKKFYGVFCFLIYSKLEDKYFAVRGVKRVLHYTFIQENGVRIGYVVNSDLDNLRRNVKQFLNIASLMTGNSYTKEKDDWIFSPNTINELGNEPKNIGDAREEEKPIISAIIYGPRGETIAKKPDGNVLELAEFMKKCQVDILELDQIFFSVFGEGLINVSSENIQKFIAAIPVLTREFNYKKEKVWSRILQRVYFDAAYIYKSIPGMQIPWFMNSKDELQEIEGKIIAAMKGIK